MFASAFQVPQQQHLMRGNQAQQTCLPGQTSISMPLYNNPMVFSQAHPITVAAQMPTDLSERQPQSNYSQDRSLRYELALSSQTCVLLAPKLQGLFSSQDVVAKTLLLYTKLETAPDCTTAFQGGICRHCLGDPATAKHCVKEQEKPGCLEV